MKLLGLVVALAVILFAYKSRLAPGKDSVDSAMAEYDQTAPASAKSSAPAKSSASAKSTAATTSRASSQAPTTGSSGLRRPIDRTRAVLEQVKQRNGNGEF